MSYPTMTARELLISREISGNYAYSKTFFRKYFIILANLLSLNWLLYISMHC